MAAEPFRLYGSLILQLGVLLLTAVLLLRRHRFKPQPTPTSVNEWLTRRWSPLTAGIAIGSLGCLTFFKIALSSAAKTQKSQVVEYRIVDRFGKTRWLMQSLRYSIDPESKIAWLDGTMIDITTSKKAA